MNTTANADRIDTSRAALIVYDACRRALAPADPARRAAMRPVLDAWVTLIGGGRPPRLPLICSSPVWPAEGAAGVVRSPPLRGPTGAAGLTESFRRRPGASGP